MRTLRGLAGSWITKVTLASALSLVWVSCGLGTEVGNGVKPKKDDGNGKKTSAASDKAPEPETTTAAQAPKSEGDDTSTASPVDGGAEPDDNGYDFRTELLAAHCASPFAESLSGTFKFSTVAADATKRNVLIAGSPAAGSWQIKDKDDKVLFTTTKDSANGALAVTVKDAQDTVVVDVYTCSAVTTETDATITGWAGTYTKKTIHIGNESTNTEVSWYLKAIASSANFQLVRLTFDDVDGESDPVVLDEEATKSATP